MEAMQAEDVHGQDQMVEEAAGPAPLTVLQASTTGTLLGILVAAAGLGCPAGAVSASIVSSVLMLPSPSVPAGTRHPSCRYQKAD